jgi:hypothetical protein
MLYCFDAILYMILVCRISKKLEFRLLTAASINISDMRRGAITIRLQEVFGSIVTYWFTDFIYRSSEFNFSYLHTVPIRE